MIVGENARAEDLNVNPTKEKHLTNIRSSNAEAFERMASPRKLTLDEALEFVSDDECVEVTPESVRLRKLMLGKVDRHKEARARR
jgi:GTP-binding protein